MKNFFHLTISVILGSLLGYSLYYKILKKGPLAEANTVAVDELFFADNTLFEKKQQEAIALNRASSSDTLQVNVQLFETSQPNKSTVAAAGKHPEAKPIRIIETMRPIEVAQLQKNKTISIPVNKITPTDMVELAPVHPEAVVQEASAATTPDTEVVTQEPAEKKRFLFFSKKSRNN
jgi:hypothetical protein